VAAEVKHLEAAEAVARENKLEVLGTVLRQLGEAHLKRNEPGRAAVALEESLEHLPAKDPMRERAQSALDEARQREEEPEAEELPASTPVDPAEAASPEATERILAMIDRLLEGDPNMGLPELLDLILAELVTAAKADRGFVLLREPGEGLVIRAARDARGFTIVDPARQISRKIAERAASESIALRAVRPAEDPRFAGSRSAKALDLQAVVAAPLRYRRIDLGSVVLDRKGKKVAFDDAAEALVARFAKLASGQIVRTRRRDAEKRRTEALEDLFARGSEQVKERVAVEGFVGQSEATYNLLRLLERLAPTDTRVLIRGESGTGKELVAKTIHKNSARAEAPFHAVNCGALAESLLEDELFGHVKGAFSGAEADREGLFEQSDTGTLFLDEIGDASPRLQAELLRVLQEGEVRRVGDQQVRKVDVRVLAATQDIPLLARHFAQEARGLLSDPSQGHPLTDETLEKLQTRDWPGNIRELRNAVQRLITVGDLAPQVTTTPKPVVGPAHLRDPLAAAPEEEVLTLAEAERRAIVRALRKSGGAKKDAANLLGTSRRTLYNKIRA
jgi:Nif-specific regulatory protein